MVLSLDRWVGKVAVVTGASSGIGAGIAERLVQEGLIVVGLARRVERIQERALQLSNQKGKLIAIKVDMTQESEIVAAFKKITSEVGPIHILINNAGLAVKTDLIGGDASKWKSVFDVNVIGLCIATKEAIEIMKENKINGHIFHINSRAGHVPIDVAGLNVYPASKYAVTALAETLMQEIRRDNLKIKITSLSPGLVTSELTTENPNIGDRREIFKNAPILNVDDIADGVVYALSTSEHVQINELSIMPLGEHFG